MSFPLSQAIRPTMNDAVALHRAGKLDEAALIYERVLAQEPNQPDALHLLGTIALGRGDHGRAVDLIGHAIRFRPGVAAFHVALGIAEARFGRPDAAVAAFLRAASLPEPGCDRLVFTHAVAAHRAGRIAEAEAAYRGLLAARPTHAEAANNLGLLVQMAGRIDAAISLFQAALAARPDYPEALVNLGVALQTAQRIPDAEQALKRALVLAPEFADAHFNFGLLSGARGDMTRAEAAYMRTLELAPDHARAMVCLANVRLEQGRIDEGEGLHRRAIHVDANLAEAHFGLAHILLLRGALARGWREYEWRFHLAGRSRRGFSVPRWRGEVLNDRTLFLHAEQGLGDFIQFLRYLPLVRARARDVVLEVPAPILPLVPALRGVRLVARGDSPPPFAVEAPLLSLPAIFATSLETIPPPSCDLTVPADRMAAWRSRIDEAKRLAGGMMGGLAVGLVWAGNPGHARDRLRSIPAPELAPLLAVPGLRFFSLQKEPKPGDLAQLNDVALVTDLGSGFRDMADTAAALMGLDLLVSVDTAVLHLAGTLGRPAWAFLQRLPDWRWLLDRSDSPWYPSITLYRQARWNAWDEPIGRAAADLKKLASGNPTGT